VTDVISEVRLFIALQAVLDYSRSRFSVFNFFYLIFFIECCGKVTQPLPFFPSLSIFAHLLLLEKKAFPRFSSVLSIVHLLKGRQLGSDFSSLYCIVFEHIAYAEIFSIRVIL